MRESEIIFETKFVWVHQDKQRNAYVVYRSGLTHSISDSAYLMTEDGKSIAIARAQYLSKQAEVKCLSY